MRKFLSTALVVCGIPFLPAAELPEVVAKFGNVELKRELFLRFRLPDAPGERQTALKKLVDTEVYLILVRRLLEQSGIPADENTARRYVAFRKAQFGGKLPPSFLKSLESRIKNPDFQLKSALYFIFLAADPAAVEPAVAEVGRHYELNKSQFQTQVSSEISLFRVGKNDEAGRERARLVLARLRQGEEFQTLAAQFDPRGVRNRMPPGSEALFARHIRELKPGESTAAAAGPDIYMLKLISRKAARPLPLQEVAPYIRELLSGRMLKNSLEQYMREMLTKTPVQYFF